MISSEIIGGGKAKNRSKLDYYPTPPEATQALLDFLHHRIEKNSTIWECACGTGDMVNVLKNNGYSVIATDIAFGTDFLTCETPKCDWIITNPPFSLADKFIARAYDIGVPFAMLLKSQFWHSKKRIPLFEKCRPIAVLPLTFRPDFGGKGKPLMDCIWCVWNPQRLVSFPIYYPLKKPNTR